MSTRTKPTLRLLECSMVWLCFVLATYAQEAKKSDTAAVDMVWGERIPMRDSVHLNATVFKPHNQKEPLPVIFTFTPDIGDSYTDRAMYFASQGYVYALVDVRGRGNSEPTENSNYLTSLRGH